MARNAIRAITLDLDDTLWPVGPTIVRAEELAHAWLTERAAAVAADWPTPRLRELRASIYEARTELRHDLLEIRRLALAHAFEQCGIGCEISAPTIAGALDIFMTARNEVEL